MKNIFLSIILVCTICPSYGQIVFESGDFASVIEKAGSENKLIFVDCYTSWCGPCKQMAAVIFPSKEAGDFMNKHFICFKADMEKGEGIEIRKRYNVNAFPTLLILKSNGEELNRTAGMDPDVAYFISKIKELSNPVNSLEFKKSDYENDITNANKYLTALHDARKGDEFEKTLMEVFNKRTPSQRYDLQNFEIYNQSIENVNHPLSVMILNDRVNFIKYLREEYYNKFICEKTRNAILSIYMNNLLKVNIDDCNNFIKFSKQYKEIRNTYIYSFFEESYKYMCLRDIENFMTICRKYYKDADSFDKKNIQRLAGRVCITSNNKKMLAEFSEYCLSLDKELKKLTY